MKKKVMTDELLARATDLRRRSWSVEAIAAEIGVSRGCLSWHFLKEGVDPPKLSHQSRPPLQQSKTVRRGNHQVRLFTDAEDQQLIALEAQGKSYSEIARALRRQPNSIRGRLMTLARREAREEAAQ